MTFVEDSLAVIGVPMAWSAARQDEWPEVGAWVVEGGPEREPQPIARLLGDDDRIHVPAGGGVAGVELALIVLAHGVELTAQRAVGLGARLGQPVELGAEQRAHRALPFHDAHSPGRAR